MNHIYRERTNWATADKENTKKITWKRSAEKQNTKKRRKIGKSENQRTPKGRWRRTVKKTGNIRWRMWWGNNLTPPVIPDLVMVAALCLPVIPGCYEHRSRGEGGGADENRPPTYHPVFHLHSFFMWIILLILNQKLSLEGSEILDS